MHAGITIGRAPEVTTKTQKLKATVCLAEDFPLDLRDQVMPIIDLHAWYIRGCGSLYGVGDAVPRGVARILEKGVLIEMV